jgi:hypothetical protein
MNDFVYFVECDPNIEPDTNLLKFVKVGKSSSLLGIKKRIVNFGVGNPFKLTFLGYIIGNETELHNRFINYKRKGEWFFLTKEFQKEINSLNLTKENCNDVASSFYNDFIIDEYILTKKNNVKNKLKEESKNNFFKKAQERKDKNLSLDFSSIEVFVSGKFSAHFNQHVRAFFLELLHHDQIWMDRKRCRNFACGNWCMLWRCTRGTFWYFG